MGSPITITFNVKGMGSGSSDFTVRAPVGPEASSIRISLVCKARFKAEYERGDVSNSLAGSTR